MKGCKYQIYSIPKLVQTRTRGLHGDRDWARSNLQETILEASPIIRAVSLSSDKHPTPINKVGATSGDIMPLPFEGPGDTDVDNELSSNEDDLDGVLDMPVCESYRRVPA